MTTAKPLYIDDEGIGYSLLNHLQPFADERRASSVKSWSSLIQP
jgi:hypothetical protein